MNHLFDIYRFETIKKHDMCSKCVQNRLEKKKEL